MLGLHTGQLDERWRIGSRLSLSPIPVLMVIHEEVERRETSKCRGGGVGGGVACVNGSETENNLVVLWRRNRRW